MLLVLFAANCLCWEKLLAPEARSLWGEGGRHRRTTVSKPTLEAKVLSRQLCLLGPGLGSPGLPESTWHTFCW